MNDRFSQEAADRLNDLESKLTKTIARQEQAQAEFDLQWSQVFEEFDIECGDGLPTSFVCQDGFKLARVVPNMQPQVDQDKLLVAISEHLGAEEANKLWKKITEVKRVVVQDKLAEAIVKNPALGVAIDASGAVTKPERSPSRIRRRASKKELQLLGIQQPVAAEDDEEEAVG